MIIERISEIKKQAILELDACEDLANLEEIKIKYSGRKGVIAELFTALSKADASEKPKLGQAINNLKNEISNLIQNCSENLQNEGKNSVKIDLTLPVTQETIGRTHPIKKVMKNIISVFVSMGFGVAYGPEIEDNFHNFTALNFPEDHPARDMHDTFYLENKEMLLRTHTSPVQIRVMTNSKPPFNFIAPGRCYRRDTIDATHSPVFSQVEGLMVGENITFSNLKAILEEFASRIFAKDIKTRFRASFFPFTEPSAELDIMCGLCNGKGCPSCSHNGWLEILGAGMVDPEVFKHCGLDPDKWQGFAFGMGVERIAMLKYGITDMRLFYQNDLRFLRQF